MIEPEFASEDFLLRSLGGGGKSFSVPIRTCSVTCDVFARNFLCFFVALGCLEEKQCFWLFGGALQSLNVHVITDLGGSFGPQKKIFSPPLRGRPHPTRRYADRKARRYADQKVWGFGFPFSSLI